MFDLYDLRRYGNISKFLKLDVEHPNILELCWRGFYLLFRLSWRRLVWRLGTFVFFPVQKTCQWRFLFIFWRFWQLSRFIFSMFYFFYLFPWGHISHKIWMPKTSILFIHIISKRVFNPFQHIGLRIQFLKC